MKTIQFFTTLILTMSLFSCSKQDLTKIFQENKTNPTEVSNDSIKQYHFITYDVKNHQKNVKFILKIKQLARVKGGKILTKGIKGECVERECSEVNFVLAFYSTNAGDSFFNSYQKSLKSLSKKAAKKLSYIVTSSETIPAAVFNEDIITRAYAIVKINVTDPAKLNQFYSVPARTALIESRGNYMVLDPNQQCRIGECPKTMALLGFESKSAVRNWYFSEAYQRIIPFRLEATTGGGIFLTK